MKIQAALVILVILHYSDFECFYMAVNCMAVNCMAEGSYFDMSLMSLNTHTPEIEW